MKELERIMRSRLISMGDIHRTSGVSYKTLRRMLQGEPVWPKTVRKIISEMKWTLEENKALALDTKLTILRGSNAASQEEE